MRPIGDKMVYRRDEIKNIVRDFVNRLEKEIPVEKVIVFGSYAYGKPNRASDLDLAVVSPGFKRMPHIKRIMLLSAISRYVKTPRLIDIDPLGFTEEDIRNSDYFGLAGEISENGDVIYAKHNRKK
jgi:predicted nucleotidyltransferase